MSEIKIESGVPLPKKYAQRQLYPFPQMHVGDSFATETPTNRVSAAAYIYGRHHNMKFTVRAIDGGCRCWRIK